MTHQEQPTGLGDVFGELGDALGEAARRIAQKVRAALGGEPEPEPIPIPVTVNRPHSEEFQADLSGVSLFQ